MKPDWTSMDFENAPSASEYVEARPSAGEIWVGVVAIFAVVALCLVPLLFLK